MSETPVHPVDEKLPAGRLAALGLQHVLVMYAGAVAVPLIVGRALKLAPEQVALLISADLFACGIVTLIQSLGFTRWFGIRLPVMMGVTFAAVGPMGRNLTVFVGTLYVLRGYGIYAWFISRRVAVVSVLLAVVAFPLSLVLTAPAALGLGLTDTWLDWRARIRVVRPGSGGPLPPGRR